jgi:protein-L-isoaspartate(D-aspartate) O-methyltransferase
MDRATELGIVRRAFAKQITAAVGVDDRRIEAAFAEVPREDFLGPGPWPIIRWTDDYVPTPSADPVYLYVDHVVGIVPERHINNGAPSFHARLIARAAPDEGEHVVHVGAGVGYYTAILAHLVGRSGRVTAIEFDPALAARAEANLSSLPHVHVVEGDGSLIPFDAANVIYVNAGATRPADAWLDRLSEDGRLILPLTTDKGFMKNDPPDPLDRRGAVFRIERRGPEFLAQWVSPVAVIPCQGVRDAVTETALAAAFKKGGWKQVTRLYRNDDVPDERCWLRAPGWCLAYS